MIINRLARGTGCGIEPLSQTLRVSPVGPLGKPVQVYQSLSIQSGSTDTRIYRSPLFTLRPPFLIPSRTLSLGTIICDSFRFVEGLTQTTLQNSQDSATSCMLISFQHSIVLITSLLRMLYCLLTATPAGENGKKGAFQPHSPPPVCQYGYNSSICFSTPTVSVTSSPFSRSHNSMATLSSARVRAVT